MLDELGVSPSTLTVGSNGAIRESVQVGLGITLISRDALAHELEDGTLEEWRCPPLPRYRAWHLAARTAEDLAATAALFVDHLGAGLEGDDGFSLLGSGARGVGFNEERKHLTRRSTTT
jgi:LysR family transcriptional regulator, low CO2-responsive transcriptional regulator